MKRLFIIGLLRGLALLPWGMIQALGRWLGELWVRIPNRQRRDALINIRLCLPHLSAAEQSALRHRSMVQWACTYVEMAALWQWPAQRVLALIRQVSGAELLFREPGRGLIALSPHLGAWELAGLYMAAQGRITSLYRPQRHLDDFILAARQRSGGVLVPDHASGVKSLLRAVKRGEQVGILPDQVTREETGAVFAPFFGIPAVTMLLVAGLARRSHAQVVFVFAERLPDGQGFHLHCLPAPPGIDSEDDLIAATALNQGVEQCIQRCPDQYQWTYRRFRRRPNAAPNPYTGPSV
jgi:Kdo2-lipid IVA lauroyltransferase/acyltransferase